MHSTQINNTIKLLLIMFGLILPQILCSIQYTFSLQYLTMVKFNLKFDYLVNSGHDCRIQVSSKSSNIQTILYLKLCTQLFQQNATEYSKLIKVQNFQLTTIEVNIKFSNYNFSSQVSKLYLNSLIVTEDFISSQNIQAALLIKQDIYEYMLPFSLLDQKAPQVIVEEDQKYIKRVRHTEQVFIETYWNQYGKDSIILTWLPYFSNCNFVDSGHIKLNQLLFPSYFKSVNKDQGLECKDSWNIFTRIKDCPDKIISLICTLEKLPKTQYRRQWYENAVTVPMYFFRNQINRQDLKEYIQHEGTLEKLSEKYFQELVPLEYSIKYNQWKNIPNNFQLSFTLNNQNDPKLHQMYRAQMVSKFDETLFQQENADEFYSPLVKLDITVNYSSLYQKFANFYMEIYWYVIAGICVFILGCGIKSFFTQKLRLKQVQKNALIVFPIFKGFIFAFCTCFGFLCIIFFLTSLTNFETISTSFDGDLSGVNQNYQGRVAFTLFLVGFFLLGIGLKQAFKIPSVEDTKIILEDDENEKLISTDREGEAKIKTNTIFQIENSSILNQNSQEKRNFLIKNMNSHAKRNLLSVLSFSLLMYALFYFILNKDLIQSILYFLFLAPFIQKMIITIYRHFVMKEMLYLYPIVIVFQVFNDMFLFSHQQFRLILILYMVKLISVNIISVYLQILTEYLAYRICNYMKKCESFNQVTCWYRIFVNFRFQIFEIANQSKYQKTLFYTGLLAIPIVSNFGRIFLFLLLLLTISYNQIGRLLEFSKQQFISRGIIMTFYLSSLELLFILLNIKFFETKLKIGITKLLQFQAFKFRNRKTNWVNDQFSQNKNIIHFYKEYQKFSMSSQLYMMVFQVVFALCIILVSFQIFSHVQSIIYKDPALLVIVMVVFIIGYICSILLNFLSIKLKLYARKQQYRMRAKLETIEKILRKNDYSQYLEIEVVKDYFLVYCKHWIITNFSKIFNFTDFQQNDCELLKRYKFYKNLLKKKEIKKKKLIIEQTKIKQNQEQNFKHKSSKIDAQNLEKGILHNKKSLKKNIKNKINGKNAMRSIDYQKDLNSLAIQDQQISVLDPFNQGNPNTIIQDKAMMLKQSPNLSNNNNIIKWHHGDFEQLAKPTIYYWFHLAKQFTVLKKMVAHVKDEKKKAACEMCSMNIELEAIQKTQFHEIVNEYRILNVGRCFVERHFVDFYRFRQQYITVCFECKQKNLHLEKKKIQLTGAPLIIMKKWLLTARSHLLHHRYKNETQKIQSIEISKQSFI